MIILGAVIMLVAFFLTISLAEFIVDWFDKRGYEIDPPAVIIVLFVLDISILIQILYSYGNRF